MIESLACIRPIVALKGLKMDILKLNRQAVIAFYYFKSVGWVVEVPLGAPKKIKALQ